PRRERRDRPHAEGRIPEHVEHDRHGERGRGCRGHLAQHHLASDHVDEPCDGRVPPRERAHHPGGPQPPGVAVGEEQRAADRRERADHEHGDVLDDVAEGAAQVVDPEGVEHGADVEQEDRRGEHPRHHDDEPDPHGVDARAGRQQRAFVGCVHLPCRRGRHDEAAHARERSGTYHRGMSTQAEPLEHLRRRTSAKWGIYPDDVLPMFVAEMDYPLAPEIAAALRAAIERSDTGYVNPSDTSAVEAFAAFARERWGWAPAVADIRTTTDVSVAIVETLRRLAAPGDGVIITPPVYPPFFDLVPEAGARVVEVPLRTGTNGAALDLAGIDRALAAGARGVLLCNPHNPLGLVHTRDELAELARIVARHDGFVVSDEIHAPLTHPGVAFTPYLSVSEEARAHGIAAESGSKAFNLAGLKAALIVPEGERMARLVRELPEEVSFRTGHLGLLATGVGFARSRGWADATIAGAVADVGQVATRRGE